VKACLAVGNLGHREPFSPLGSSDFRTLVAASLKGGVPDVVVVAGRQQETGAIARLLRDARVQPVEQVATGGVGIDVVAKILPRGAQSREQPLNLLESRNSV
jgi:hypothetical protein